MVNLNGDLTAVAVVDTGAMEWSPSPSGSVWRKRVHRVGPAESGQVTSVVRYEPESSFPAHDHPEGEEILVLDGTFSDEHGDWPAGTYLLNPEGFRHAPFSREGCRLLVKLRQYPGAARRHVVVQTNELSWRETSTPGLYEKPLYSQEGFSDTVRLQRFAAGFGGLRRYVQGAELFILSGGLEDEVGSHAAGTWLRFPEGAAHRVTASVDVTLYLKGGGFAYLRSGAHDERRIDSPSSARP
jgi:hypothetical protein